MRCERCGTENKPGDIFCRGCGTRLDPAGKGAAVEPVISREEDRLDRGAAAAPPPSRHPPPPPVRAPGPPHASGWSVASVVFGILSFVLIPFVGGLLAVVSGVISRRRVKRPGAEEGGSGMSTAGIVLGTINLSFFLVAAAVFIPWAVINLGKVRSVSRTVFLQGAEEVTAELDIREGGLSVGGGAEALFEGEFSYNVDGWEPDINYGIDQGRGLLKVEQGEDGRLPIPWYARNDWDISFNDSVPLELKTLVDSGEAYLDLGGLTLESLEVDSSSGDVEADLSGDMASLRSVDISQSSGDLVLTMEGRYTSYTRLDVENSGGSVLMSLLGKWEDTLGAAITSSSGDVTLKLPRDVGVRVTAAAASGKIEAPGLKAEVSSGDETVYSNRAYGESVITLQFDIQVSSGDIHLLLEE